MLILPVGGEGRLFALEKYHIGLSYSAQDTVKIGCSSARIYVSANNLWTITNYSGFDPEASMGADSDAAGVDRGVYPSSKSFLVGWIFRFNDHLIITDYELSLIKKSCVGLLAIILSTSCADLTENLTGQQLSISSSRH